MAVCQGSRRTAVRVGTPLSYELGRSRDGRPKPIKLSLCPPIDV
jgi:hypothetical protein